MIGVIKSFATDFALETFPSTIVLTAIKLKDPINMRSSKDITCWLCVRVNFNQPFHQSDGYSTFSSP